MYLRMYEQGWAVVHTPRLKGKTRDHVAPLWAQGREGAWNPVCESALSHGSQSWRSPLGAGFQRHLEDHPILGHLCRQGSCRGHRPRVGGIISLPDKVGHFPVAPIPVHACLAGRAPLPDHCSSSLISQPPLGRAIF